MAEVIVNVGANTQDANAQINQLNQSLGQTGNAAEVAAQKNEQLEATLKKQEATIKTIDGAVNLLGGSVELLAGSLVLSGAATEEQAKEFEAAALGAIALADGAKRTIDGIKSLNEGLAAYGGISAIATKATQALFTVLKANPIAAVTTALVGLVAIYSTLTKESNKQTKSLQRNLELFDEIGSVVMQTANDEERLLEVLTDNVEQRGLENKAIEDLKKAYPGFIAFLDSENKLTQQGIAFLNARIKLRKAEAGLGAVATKQVEAEVELARQYAQIDIDEEGRFTQRRANRRQAARDERDVILAELKTLSDQYSTEVNDALLELEGFNKILAESVTNAETYAKVTQPYLELLQSVRYQVSLLNKETFESVFKQEGSILDVRYVGDLDTSLDALSQTLTDLQANLEVLNDEETYKFLSFPQELLDRLSGLAPQSELDKALAQRKKQFDEEYALLEGNLYRQKQLEEEYAKDVAKIKREIALKNTQEILSITSNFLTVIADINQANLDLQLAQAGNNQQAIDAINKKAFEQQKNLRIAQTLITTAESILNGYNSASSLGFPLNLIVGSVLGASYAALGAKTIQTINATQYGGGSSSGGGYQNIPQGGFGGINIPTGGGTPVGGIPTGGLPGLGGGRLGTAPTIGTIAEGPIRAYVLAGDVTNGVQANIALNNRRRLAG